MKTLIKNCFTGFFAVLGAFAILSASVYAMDITYEYTVTDSNDSTYTSRTLQADGTSAVITAYSACVETVNNEQRFVIQSYNSYASDNRYIGIPLSGPCKIEIYANKYSSATGTVYFQTGTAPKKNTKTTDTATLPKSSSTSEYITYNYTGDSATTLYMWSTSDKMSLRSVKLTYTMDITLGEVDKKPTVIVDGDDAYAIVLISEAKATDDTIQYVSLYGVNWETVAPTVDLLGLSSTHYGVADYYAGFKVDISNSSLSSSENIQTALGEVTYVNYAS